MSVLLIISQGNQPVARIEDYDGPIPRQGEYIFHPPLDDDGTSDLGLLGHNTGIAGCVKTVAYGIYTRPGVDGLFVTKRPVQIVEVTI